MTFNSIVVLLYGVLVLMGGAVGFIVKESYPSLIMGSILGVLLIISSLAMWKESIYGYFLALGSSVVLASFFAYRFYLTSSWMPAGGMAIVSSLVVLMLLTTKKTY